MPNYVINKIIFADKKDCAKAKELVGDIARDDVFDFNKIVKMPRRLNILSGSVSVDASNLFSYIRGDDDVSRECIDSILKRYPATPVCCSVTEFYSEEQRCPKTLAELILFGSLMNENKKKYGAVDWYDWKYENWGTKWNALEVYWGDEHCEFQTAWENVAELLGVMSKMLGICFEYWYADEDLGSNCGHFTIENGDVYEMEDDSTVGVEFAARIWDYDDEDILEILEEYGEHVEHPGLLEYTEGFYRDYVKEV